MSKKFVVSRKSLPTSLPIQVTVIGYLLLDKFHPAEWVWGAVVLFLVLLWINSIILIINEEQVDFLNTSS